MKKILTICFVLVFALTGVQAQEKEMSQNCKVDSCSVVNYAPQTGDFTVAMVFGRGAYMNSGLSLPSATWVNGTAPYDNGVEANYNDITNMVGAEARYYINKKFALTLSGGAILRNTPAQINIPGVYDDGSYYYDSSYSYNGQDVVLPYYAAVVADERIDVNATIGAQWLFTTKNNRLFPYLGFALPFDYARRSVYDPTVEVNEAGETYITNLSARHVDITAFGIQAVAGVDYYLAKDVFFGFDIKPVSYTYAMSVKSPGAGMLKLESDTNTVSFFAQFSFKLGFKF